jgi:hypothetical protein
MVGYLLLAFQGLQASDAYGYHLSAEQLAASWSANDPPPDLTPGKEGWIWILASAYFAATPDPLIGVAINSTLMALSLVLIARVGSALWGTEQHAFRAAVLFLLVPGFWYWGSIPLREAVVTFATSLLAFAVVRDRPAVPLAALALGVLTWTRGSLAVLVGIALGVALLLRPNRRGGPGNMVGRITMASIGLVISLTVLGDLEHETSAERMSAVRNAQSGDATTGFEVTEGESGLGAALFSGVPRVAFGPFPWELPSIGALIPMALAWFGIVWLAGRGTRDAWRRGVPIAPLLLCAGAILVALSLYSGNYGTMIRLRDQAVPFLIPLAAGGFGRGSSNSAAISAARARKSGAS